MNTNDLMQIALDLVGFETIPADSAVYVPGDNINKVLFGLDIGTAELLMARHFGYDCVIAHHPVGVAHKSWRVFERHVELMVDAGVPEEAARAVVAQKLESLKVDGQTRNYERVPMAAQRLGMPFLNIHCPLDEMGRRVMQRTANALLAASPSATLSQVAEELGRLPAARQAETQVAVHMGDPSAPAGRVAVAHAALTNGGYPVARAYFEHGVDTVVYIHIFAADLEKLRAEGDGQLIVTGHVTGDAFGIAPYLLALRERGLEVHTLSKVLDPANWSAP